MTVRNWNDTARCDPARVATPTRLEELQAIVTDAGRHPSPLRAAGSLHSLTPCFTTTGTLVSMRGFDAIGEPAAGAVTVGAGVRMIDLRNALRHRGLQIPVTPEIGNATAGSVACCGTKDASLAGGPGQISAAVTGVKWVDAAGQRQQATQATDPDRLRVMRSSYGLLGVVYEVTFRTCPLQRLRYRYEWLDLDAALTADRVLGGADGCLAFFLPFHGKVLAERRTLDATATVGPVDLLKLEIRNLAWKSGGRPLSDLPEAFDHSLQLFADPVLMGHFDAVRVDTMIDFLPGGRRFFDFTFWAFPRTKWSTVVPAYVEFCAGFRDRTGFRPNLPTEVYLINRDAPGEGSLLSFAHDREVFTLDLVHTVPGPDGATWDRMNVEFNDFAAAHEGRPLLNQTKQLGHGVVVQTLGSDWTRFAALRATADPTGRFLSPFFADLLP